MLTKNVQSIKDVLKDKAVVYNILEKVQCLIEYKKFNGSFVSKANIVVTIEQLPLDVHEKEEAALRVLDFLDNLYFNNNELSEFDSFSNSACVNCREELLQEFITYFEME